MGTTLHAAVQLYFPAHDGRPATWETVSRWWFNKDYEVMMSLSEAKAEVPFGIGPHWHRGREGGYLPDSDWPDEAEHCSGFREFVLSELPDVPGALRYQSMLASVEALVEDLGERARVLFWQI